MSKLCLNPACKNPQNPEQNNSCHGCGAKLVESTQSYLFDCYRVTKLLGEGAFGRTYLAEYLHRYHEPRLIKTLITRENQQNQPKIQELFIREAKQLCHLDHPQIPKLYEYFERDNNLYLVQEFIDGMSLSEEFQKQGPFQEQKIQTILEEILPVLVYIQEQNLLHRDIKPANIMRRRSDGVLMLIDFGAARVKTGSDPTVLTAIYTPGYAAIEQMMGRPVKASDVYSLGITCIRLLTGCVSSGPTDLIYNHHENCLCWKEYLQARNIKVSARLIAILDKMVASSLRIRYPDALAVLKDLWPPISLPLSLPTVAEKEQNSTVPPTFSVPSQTLVKSFQRLGLLAGVVATLTGVVGIGGYLLINQPQTRSHHNPNLDNRPVNLKAEATTEIPTGVLRFWGPPCSEELMLKKIAKALNQDNKFKALWTDIDSRDAISELIDKHTSLVLHEKSQFPQNRERAREEGTKLEGTPYALDGIAYIVNKKIQVAPYLTIEQLEKIYRGEITKWKEVGGEDLIIKPILLSGLGRNSLFLNFKGKLNPNMIYVQDRKKAIPALHKNPGALFYTSATLAVAEKNVKIIPLQNSEGVIVPPVVDNKPNQKAFSEGSYPQLRTLFAIYRKENNKEGEMVKTFINYLTSPEGQSIVKDAGFVPLYIPL